MIQMLLTLIALFTPLTRADQAFVYFASEVSDTNHPILAMYDVGTIQNPKLELKSRIQTSIGGSTSFIKVGHAFFQTNHTTFGGLNQSVETIAFDPVKSMFNLMGFIGTNDQECCKSSLTYQASRSRLFYAGSGKWQIIDLNPTTHLPSDQKSVSGLPTIGYVGGTMVFSISGRDYLVANVNSGISVYDISESEMKDLHFQSPQVGYANRFYRLVGEGRFLVASGSNKKFLTYHLDFNARASVLEKELPFDDALTGSDVSPNGKSVMLQYSKIGWDPASGYVPYGRTLLYDSNLTQIFDSSWVKGNGYNGVSFLDENRIIGEQASSAVNDQEVSGLRLVLSAFEKGRSGKIQLHSLSSAETLNETFSAAYFDR